MKRLKLVVLFFIPLLVMATTGENKMTPLDKAHEAAMKNPEKQSDYYTLFLNSEIFIPTHDVPTKEGRKRAGKNETIKPIIIESDGNQFLMLFDTKDRLNAWAQREVGFVAVPGHTIVEMIPDIQWVLNVGTNHEKVFVLDEIKWLKGFLDRFGEAKISEGTKVLVGAPAKIPTGLVESITKNLSRNLEVNEAYLGQVYYVMEGEVSHLALVLRIGKLSQSAIDAIRKDLAIASQGFLGNDGYIDIFIDDGSGITSDITKAVKPFYVQKNTH